MRMKRFTLALFTAVCCLAGHASVSIVDDLTGIYSVTATGTEKITNYKKDTDMSTKTYSVEISKNDDGTVAISNLLGFGSTLTGTVDLTTKTITIAPGYVSWTTFASSATSDGSGSVTAEFTDEGVITVHDFAGWYYATNYISDGATVTLTKSSITKEWTVEGQVAYSDAAGDSAYYVGRTTLSKYSGTDDYDYILKCDEGGSPTELQFKVADGQISIVNGYQTAGYAGAYFYYIYPNNYCVWLDTSDGYATFAGDKDSGELYIYCYEYSSSGLEHEGYMSFLWGTYDGIEAPAAVRSSADAPVYDLSGRRVSKPTKGIYICNGKKFFVK